MRSLLVMLGYVVIFLTGAAGLVYQVAWQKYLSRLLGADSIATAIILATFLGGLSLGYYLCGKFSTRLNHPLRGFALLEGAIGIWGLAFPTIFAVIDRLTRSWSFSAPFLILLQGFFCSVLLIGLPTICMGGTVPWMTRGISRNLKEATGVHAAIYSINTAGAVLGALLAGFYLMPQFGLPGTVRGTALVNLGACLFFLLIAIWVKPYPSDATEPVIPGTEEQSSSRFPAPVLYVVALASGFYVMMLENVLIRFANFSLGSSSYSFSLVVAVFILAIAVGSGIVSRLQKLPASLLFWNQLVIAVSLLLVYYSLDIWPYAAHILRSGSQSNTIGFWQYYICVFLTLTGVLIVPVACMGATIPIAFHELKRDLHTVGRHSGFLLSWNTVGSLTGSLIGGVVLYYLFNRERIFLISVLLAGGSVCLVARYLSRKHLISGGILTAVAFLLIVFTPFFNRDRFMSGTFVFREPFSFTLSSPATFYGNINNRSKLLFFDDDPISTIGVMEGAAMVSTKPSLSIMVNGKSDSSTGSLDLHTIKLLAHLPALLAKSRQEVFIIGLGTGVTAGEMTLYPDVERIDVAEISPAVIKALPFFSDFTHEVHKNPKLHLHNGDAFRVLGRSEKKWDVIISEPSNPWVTGVDLLFTREFYAMVKNHLKEGGVFIQWVQQYDSSMEMMGMILNTICQEFPQSRLFGSTMSDLMIVASEKALTAADVRRAEEVIMQNDRLRESLRELNLDRIDSLLIREAWTPSYFRGRFASFGMQTMDHPRLHYVAGRDFFHGFMMNTNVLWDSRTINFIPEYLMAMKYPDWEKHAFSPSEMQTLISSMRTRDESENTEVIFMMPPHQSLLLKAFLSNPNLYPLSIPDYQQLGLPVQFVVSVNQAKLDWAQIGLRDATFRQKAEFLQQHIEKTRNWIVPYPLDGLHALLQQGISESMNPYERTWCALQLSLLIGLETGNRRLIQEIIGKVRDYSGKLLVADADLPLMTKVQQMVNNLPQF